MPKPIKLRSVYKESFLFDYSKQNISDDELKHLFKLCDRVKLKDQIKALFNGEKINKTENRAALHPALRDYKRYLNLSVDHQNIGEAVENSLLKMEHFVNKLYNKEIKGYTGKPITDVINIGIGGSDLGPWMTTTALRTFRKGINVHYVSNVDSAHISFILGKLNPETSLFIISSKSFTTTETITNAEAAKKWLNAHYQHNLFFNAHFISVTSAIDKASDFGVLEENCFPMWDWVGGRFSLWSSIGLSIACAVGMDHFYSLLEGAKQMDKHFETEDYENNIPILHAICTYNNVENRDILAEANIPYSQYLNTFPAFIQQLSMESNGKRIDKEGKVIHYNTSPVVWGKAGTNSQHSFFQAIHQGTVNVSTEFIAFCQQPTEFELDNHQDILIANCIAQSEALWNGKSENQVFKELQEKGFSEEKIKALLPHKVFTGGKYSSSLFIDELTPKNLGKLIALYEHKTFVLGALWNIHSFDQWGVELGKELATNVLEEIKSGKQKTHDVSTSNLIQHYLSHKK